MTKMRPVLALVVVLAGLGLPPASAFDGRGCGGSYTGAAACRFVFRGSPLTVFGDSSATNARVRVWVTLDTDPVTPSPIGCEASAPTYATCETAYPNQTTKQNLPEQFGTFWLRCHVSGAGSGTYWCQAGHEPGTS